MPLAFLAVFISSLLWAISTQVYSKMVNRLSVTRFNFYKSLVGFICFLASAFFIGEIFAPREAVPWLLWSGFLGFFLADLFIFYSFAKNGPARTLMLAAFEPSIVAVYSYFILGKVLPLSKVVGLLFLILCLCFMALERKRRGTLSFYVAILAFIGINIEALGVVFSKKAFMIAPLMSPMTANLYRVAPAVVILLIYNHFKRVKMGVSDLNFKVKNSILVSTFLGTFLALYFYMYALAHYDHPSIIGGIGNLAPIYASIYEHWRDKKYPNRYFIGAILSMIAGVIFLLFI